MSGKKPVRRPVQPANRLEHYLPGADQDDLAWYWCFAAGELGLSSNMTATIVRMTLGDVVKTSPTHWDETHGNNGGIRLALAHYTAKGPTPQFMYVNPTHSTVLSDPMPDRYAGSRERSRRLESNLTRLNLTEGGPGHVRILYGMYGPPRPLMLYADSHLGELAYVAHYTRPVQELADRLTARLRHARAVADGRTAESEARDRVEVTPEEALVKGWKQETDAFRNEVRRECVRLFREASLAYTDARETYSEWSRRRATERKAWFKEALSKPFASTNLQEDD